MAIFSWMETFQHKPQDISFWRWKQNTVLYSLKQGYQFKIWTMPLSICIYVYKTLAFYNTANSLRKEMFWYKRCDFKRDAVFWPPLLEVSLRTFCLIYTFSIRLKVFPEEVNLDNIYLSTHLPTYLYSWHGKSMHLHSKLILLKQERTLALGHTMLDFECPLLSSV